MVETKAEGNDQGGKPAKKAKIHREKVRFGQAPRNALPDGPVETAGTDAPTAGQTAGQPGGATTAGAAPSQLATATGAGTATEVASTAAVNQDDPLTPQAAPERKTRFAAREHETDEKHAEAKLVKAQAKASVRPVTATQEDTVVEKTQAAPLGLNGDTTKKPKKAKRKKGEAKERMQDKPKEVETAAPAPALTVNPSVVGRTSTGSGSTTAAPANNGSALPSTTSAPGAPVQGQPIPATTSATPGAPTTTPVPPQ